MMATMTITSMCYVAWACWEGALLPPALGSWITFVLTCWACDMSVKAVFSGRLSLWRMIVMYYCRSSASTSTSTSTTAAALEGNTSRKREEGEVEAGEGSGGGGGSSSSGDNGSLCSDVLSVRTRSRSWNGAKSLAYDNGPTFPDHETLTLSEDQSDSSNTTDDEDPTTMPPPLRLSTPFAARFLEVCTTRIDFGIL